MTDAYLIAIREDLANARQELLNIEKEYADKMTAAKNKVQQLLDRETEVVERITELRRCPKCNKFYPPGENHYEPDDFTQGIGTWSCQ